MTGRALLVGGVAAWMGMTAVRAEAAPCRIEAPKAYVEDVKVTPKGAKTFALKLDKVPISAVPGAGNSATLHVKAPLRFTADSYPMNKLLVRTAKRVALLGGRVTLAPGLAPTSLGAKGRALHVRPPLTGFSLRHKTLAIPCKALTIASDDTRPTAPSFEVAKGAVEHAVPSDYIPLYRTTREAGAVWMKFSVPLLVVARKGTWIRVQAKWSDGSSVQGWVPNRLVEVRIEKMLYGIGGIGVGGIGGMCGRSHRPQLVTLTVRKNAPVYNEAGGVAWARAAKNIKVHAFTISRSDGWVRIAKVDGLPPKPCSEHSNMWVHAKHIVWQALAKP